MFLAGACRPEPEGWCQDEKGESYCGKDKEWVCTWRWWQCRKTCGKCYGSEDDVKTTNDLMTEMCPSYIMFERYLVKYGYGRID